MFTHLLVTALLACLALQASALATISVKGSKFFAGGNQFFLKGVAYQGTPDDPLVDTNQCRLDAHAMQSIGTNSIRVYHVDPAAHHDGCMAVFRNAGIYVWVDVDTFTSYIVQTDPAWTKEQFEAYAKVVDAFHHYDNLGGFWIGNEVINSLGGSPSAPYIKAAVADMKSYINAKSYRKVPIGYSAADIAELRPMLQDYLACGEADEAIDFFGLNSYEWCGDATYQTSGYSALQNMALGYNLPIFFSETGCNVGGERTFNDQKAIFGPEMIHTWSGSILYEWVEETNAYGLVTYPNGQIYSGAPIPIQPDFDNLSNVWKETSPTGVSEGRYTAKYSAPACPAATGGWSVDGDVPLPRLDSSIIKAIAAGKEAPASPNSTSKPSASLDSPTGTPNTPSTSSSPTMATLWTLVSSQVSSKQVTSSQCPSASGVLSSRVPAARSSFTSASFTLVSQSASSQPTSITIETYSQNFNPTSHSPLTTSTPTLSTTSPAQAGSSSDSGHSIRRGSNPRRQANATSSAPPPTSHSTTDQASSTTAKNRKPTTTASSPASTSKSAANAVTPPPFIAYVDNLGGHGGEIGFLVLSTILVLGAGAFL